MPSTVRAAVLYWMDRLVCRHARQTKTLLAPIKLSIVFMLPNTPYTSHYTCAGSFGKEPMNDFLIFPQVALRPVMLVVFVALVFQRLQQRRWHFPHTSSSWAWGSCSAWGEGDCFPVPAAKTGSWPNRFWMIKLS